ncbi:MAG: energy-coupling factor transporter ATPase [Eubacteriales bacterium]|nr:energy-coupling factor transporter ATPase [Eubacteriales bacterium]
MSIVIEHLCHQYSAQGGELPHPAVTDVTLTIESGEFLGVIGHTGSGKTTFVQHLNGLINATSGTITVDGHNLTDKKERAIVRSLVGMVFQYPEYQLFGETVYEDIAFGPKNMKLDQHEIDKRVNEAMELVGLEPYKFAQKSPFELSGGEKRRAALAGVIAMRPKYLVLDEPMAGLDPKGRKEILEMLESLRASSGCAIIMVSHSMDDVSRHADRILVLNEGKVAFLGTPADVFSNSDELTNMGLSLPQSAILASRLRAMGVNVPMSICTTQAMLAWIEGRLTHNA